MTGFCEPPEPCAVACKHTKTLRRAVHKCIFTGKQIARDTFLYDLGQPAGRKCEHWGRRRHCFNRDKSKGFEPARHHHNISVEIELFERRAINLPVEADAPFAHWVDAIFCLDAAKQGGIRVRSGEIEAQLRITSQMRRDLQREVIAFARLEPSGE